MSWNESAITDIPSGWNAVQDGAALLFFSMDGCPWCIRAKPVMEVVAKTLGSVVPVYKVGTGSPLVAALGVTGFPTIVYVDAFGVASVYEGERTADLIAAFVCNHASTKNSVCTKFFNKY
jgi:thiol-disulfide isomerase/thioredoxin